MQRFFLTGTLAGLILVAVGIFTINHNAQIGVPSLVIGIVLFCGSIALFSRLRFKSKQDLSETTYTLLYDAVVNGQSQGEAQVIGLLTLEDLIIEYKRVVSEFQQLSTRSRQYKYEALNPRYLSPGQTSNPTPLNITD